MGKWAALPGRTGGTPQGPEPPVSRRRRRGAGRRGPGGAGGEHQAHAQAPVGAEDEEVGGGPGGIFPMIGKQFFDGVVWQKTCDFVRAKPGRAASPLAAGSWKGPSDAVGCADAIRPEPGENRPPRISGTVLRHDGLRRAGTARPTHPCTKGIERFSPGNATGRKKRAGFSNDWKLFFQWLENLAAAGLVGVGEHGGSLAGRGVAASAISGGMARAKSAKSAKREEKGLGGRTGGYLGFCKQPPGICFEVGRRGCVTS